MRYYELLKELKMAPGTLRKFAAGPVAATMQAGFEAELIFPGEYSDDDPEPDWDEDRTLPRGLDIGDLKDFFELNSKNEFRVILDDYWAWVNDQSNIWINENLSDRIEYLKDQSDLDDDTAREKAWDELSEEFYRDPDGNNASMLDWCHDNGWYTYKDIHGQFSLDWPFLTHDHRFEDAVSDYASDLESVVGADVQIISDYHGEVKDSTSWYMEPDASIDPTNSNYMGIEIVSPPMPVMTMLSKFDDMIDWAINNGAKTNKSTGFHVGISMGTTTENIDYVKLALFLGDQYILQQFGRDANNYTKSSMKIIQRATQGNQELHPAILDNMRRGLMQAASQTIYEKNYEKYFSINMRPGYIEFRSMGGDYLNQLDQLKNTILRYVRAYAVAADPTAERQEYAKKLTKLLNPTSSDQLAPFVQFAMGDITKAALVNALAVRQNRDIIRKWRVIYTHNDQMHRHPDVVVHGKNYQEAIQAAQNLVPEWRHLPISNFDTRVIDNRDAIS